MVKNSKISFYCIKNLDDQKTTSCANATTTVLSFS